MTPKSQNSPILVMAFSRPKLLRSLLSEIDLLEPRAVHISVDGADLNSSQTKANMLVKELVSDWSITSKHEVTYNFNTLNLGLLDHFKSALESFFQNHKAGIILEDDMEFDNAFIEFIDQIHMTNSMYEYWSICGHNPLPRNDKSNFESQGVKMFETNVHTIWGWATTKESVFSYLRFLSLEKEMVLSLLETQVAAISRDPLIRHLLLENWRRKVNRFFNSDKPNWDNLWVVAGWNSGKKSLMPKISLSRENPDQTEGQTHSHETAFQPWIKGCGTQFEIIGIDKKTGRRLERELLKVWGVSRKNALYSLFQIALKLIERRKILNSKKNGRLHES
jgi:hypothetical protein